LFEGSDVEEFTVKAQRTPEGVVFSWAAGAVARDKSGNPRLFAGQEMLVVKGSSDVIPLDAAVLEQIAQALNVTCGLAASTTAKAKKPAKAKAKAKAKPSRKAKAKK